jgi:hypothetical protein
LRYLTDGIPLQGLVGSRIDRLRTLVAAKIVAVFSDLIRLLS